MTNLEIIGCFFGFYVLTLWAMFRLVRGRTPDNVFKYQLDAVAEGLEAYKTKLSVTISKLENEVIQLKSRVERVERDAVTSWKRLDQLSDFEANQITESLRKVGEDGMTDLERMYKAIDEDF